MINVHTAAGAVAACVALAFIGWVILRAIRGVQYYAGVRAFHEEVPLQLSWSAPKRAGWNRAWADEKRARLGLRG